MPNRCVPKDRSLVYLLQVDVSCVEVGAQMDIHD